MAIRVVLGISVLGISSREWEELKFMDRVTKKKSSQRHLSKEKAETNERSFEKTLEETITLDSFANSISNCGETI